MKPNNGQWHVMAVVQLPNGVKAYESEHLEAWGPIPEDCKEFIYLSLECTGSQLLPHEREGVEFNPDTGKVIGATVISPGS